MIEATLYKRPYGATETITINAIAQEDAEWFTSNGISLSLEDCGDFFAVFAKVGENEDGDPIEITEVAEAGESCESTLSRLRAECESFILQLGALE